MTKQDFIKKWIGWVSYTNREKLTNEMEVDLELVSQALRIHDVVGRSEQSSKIIDGECMLCGDVADTKDGWICGDCRKF